ncbi:hypothetical protein LTR27_002397 [Elasticomyces elasticus]|nr:hypothetical protein LTR27_002397 [Elasticomyces elasticus]
MVLLGVKAFALLVIFLSSLNSAQSSSMYCWNSRYRILLWQYSDGLCGDKIGKETKRDLVCSGECKSWKNDPPLQSVFYHYAAHRGDDLPYDKSCNVTVYEDVGCKGQSDTWNATELLSACVMGSPPNGFQMRCLTVDCVDGNEWHSAGDKKESVKAVRAHWA